MTRLLISVRNAKEAEAALAGGADVIDVKEPKHGSLGRAVDAQIREVVQRVGSRAPVSVALGELHEQLRPPRCEIRYGKVGLAGAAEDWQDQLRLLGDRVGWNRFIVVAYVDARRVAAPEVDAVIAWAIDHGTAGLLLDTAIKDGSDLFSHAADSIRRWIKHLQDCGLVVALAGGLRSGSFDRAVELEPDIVAVRGAACVQSERTSSICADRVGALKSMVRSHTSPAAARAS